MQNNINQEKSFNKRVLGNLVIAGARNLKLGKKQEMKLRECILPELQNEFEIDSGGPIPIIDIRKYIDQWESADQYVKSYGDYYVKKDSNGGSFPYRLNEFTTLLCHLAIFYILYLLFKLI